MPRDIPIIFSGAMVRALLDGRKTMTRRLAWRLGTPSKQAIAKAKEDGKFGVIRPTVPSPWQKVQPGDRLYVRENFAYVGTCDPGFLTFQATYPGDLAKYGMMENVPATLKEAGYKWTPCIHMPRGLSRLTLVVTATKVERLQDMSPEDAEAEGCQYIAEGPGAGFWIVDGAAMECCAEGAVECFERLWSGLYGAKSWDANLEVVVLSFRVVKANIDAPEARTA